MFGFLTSLLRHADLLRSTVRRVEDLEDFTANLERRFLSLQGTVTGGMRRRSPAPPEPDPEDDDDELDELDDPSTHVLGAQRRFGRS